jgi:hypothetical protein
LETSEYSASAYMFGFAKFQITKWNMRRGRATGKHLDAHL